MSADTVSAAQRAYTSTKDQILSGAYPGGALLSEVEIAEQLAVSRTPVHEAFLRLESEDLLQLIPRRGAVVVPVPPSEAVDILEVRVALEVAAVRRLVTSNHKMAELLEELAEITQRQADLAHATTHNAGTHGTNPNSSTPNTTTPSSTAHGTTALDVAEFARVDAEFHRAIVTASGNAIADRFYASLADRQRRMTIGALGSRPERASVLVREHRGLAKQISAGDVPGFEDALVRHLNATHNFLLGR